MNDIAHASKMFDFIIYADDTTLSTIIEIVIRSTTYLTISEILNDELSMVNNFPILGQLKTHVGYANVQWLEHIDLSDFAAAFMMYTLNVQKLMLKHLLTIMNIIYHGLVQHVISLHIISLIVSSVQQNQTLMTLVLVKHLQTVQTQTLSVLTIYGMSESAT